MKINSQSIVMLGATGAVGGHAVNELKRSTTLEKLTLLGRRPVSDCNEAFIYQHVIDIFSPDTYTHLVLGHTTAICCLGVGQPSKMSKEDFIKIDKLAVLNFARACKLNEVKHFQLLSSVGSNSKSASFFLRTKGELIDELVALNFDRLSIFQPSMILTPKNRYGFSQAVTLKVWPLLKPILIGGLRKFRGVPVEILGKSIAKNSFTDGIGLELLQWDDFQKLAK